MEGREGEREPFLAVPGRLPPSRLVDSIIPSCRPLLFSLFSCEKQSTSAVGHLSLSLPSHSLFCFTAVSGQRQLLFLLPLWALFSSLFSPIFRVGFFSLLCHAWSLPARQKSHV